MAKNPKWTFKEDKIILQSEDSTLLRKTLSYRNKQSLTHRIRRLRRMEYTIKRLEYEENFIKEAYIVLTQKEISNHLKIKIFDVRIRMETMKEELEKLDITKLNKQISDAFLDKKGKKVIMEEFNLKDYQYEVRKIMFNNDKETYRRIKLMEGLNNQRENERENQIKKAKEKLRENPYVNYKDAPQMAISKKDLQKRTYVNNKKYEVDCVETRMQRRYFQGRLIQETKDHITLVNEGGIRESFLKVDFKTGCSNIKEVNQ